MNRTSHCPPWRPTKAVPVPYHPYSCVRAVPASQYCTYDYGTTGPKAKAVYCTANSCTSEIGKFRCAVTGPLEIREARRGNSDPNSIQHQQTATSSPAQRVRA
eukprot:3815355-Prymnesium_polylepis.1